MSKAWLSIKPLDAITIRDGRPFDAGASAESIDFPRPYTFAGACAAALGGYPRSITGPFLSQSGGLLFPAPLDIVRTESGDLQRLVPRPPGGRTDLEGCDLLPMSEGEPAGGWITGGDLHAYLDTGRLPARIEAESPLGGEQRIGLRRTGRSADAGYLYSSTFLRCPDETTSFVGLVEGPDEVEVRDPVVYFGGESRLASVQIMESPPPLPAPDIAGSRHLLVYLVTPAVFEEGWKFPTAAQAYGNLEAPTVRCAVVGDPTPISGWTSGHPRYVKWAVPAGSVYYLEFADAGAAAAWAEKQHGRALTQDMKRRRTTGHGVCLVGKWHPEEEEK